MNRIFLLCFFVWLATGCVFEEKNENSGNSERVTIGTKLPLFSVDSLNGNPVSSADITKGKVTLLVFFHSTCGDCKREIPKIEEVWQALKTNNQFTLMSISRGESDRAVIQFQEEFGLTLPLYLDPEKKAYQLFATQTVPRIYLADKNGVVHFIAIERLDIATAELIKKIEALL